MRRVKMSGPDDPHTILQVGGTSHVFVRVCVRACACVRVRVNRNPPPTLTLPLTPTRTLTFTLNAAMHQRVHAVPGRVRRVREGGGGGGLDGARRREG